MPTENRSSNTEMVSVPEGYMLVERSIWTEQQVEAATACITRLKGVHGMRDRDLAMAAIDAAQCKAPDIALADLLPAPQPHPEPIAWMVGTAIWWTKEEAERDAEATGLPIVGLGPMTGADEAERLRDVVKHSDNQIMRQSLRISNQRTQLADRLALLREALEFIDDGVGRSDAEWRLIKKLRAALSPDGAAGASDEPYQGMPGTSFQRLNALANQGE
ncbi:hypothetical protein [Pseudomonas juntendi]|uniref:hypothetical protein n=2 Tax=Pseudomonas TaxID=286 RepID=UPI001F2FE8C2|nr:hypothetical protein [Pseudomonas juntendi]UJW24747.1 hypothetical protein L2Y89_11450 [Pseudomonas juntendi]